MKAARVRAPRMNRALRWPAAKLIITHRPPQELIPSKCPEYMALYQQTYG